MTDEELDNLIDERAAKKTAEIEKAELAVQNDTTSAPSTVPQTIREPMQNYTAKTTFTEAIDQAKINVVKEASANDDKFVKGFKDKLKDATIKLAEIEEQKAELEKQNIQYHQELLEKDQELNAHQKAENDWENKQKKREYHYNGVKPIMEFVGIKEPMNLFLLYALTFILVWFFLIAKLFKGTVGALIAGAEDTDRPKAVKGFLWTMVAAIVMAIIGIITVLIMRWMNII